VLSRLSSARRPARGATRSGTYHPNALAEAELGERVGSPQQRSLLRFPWRVHGALWVFAPKVPEATPPYRVIDQPVFAAVRLSVAAELTNTPRCRAGTLPT